MGSTAGEQPTGAVWRYSDGDKLASLNSRFTVNMCYTNRTSKLVEVFWINFEGREVTYGRVKPGSTTLLYTYLTHPWVFRYEGGDDTILHVNGKPVSWPSQHYTHADITEAPRLRWNTATHVSDFRRRAPTFARDVQNLLLAYSAQRKPGSKRGSGGDGGDGTYAGRSGRRSQDKGAAAKAVVCPSPTSALPGCCGGKLWNRRGTDPEAPRELEAAFAEQRISSPQTVPSSAAPQPSGPFVSRHSSPPSQRSAEGQQQPQPPQTQAEQHQPSLQTQQGLLGQLPYDVVLEIIAHMAPPLQEELPILKDDVELLPCGVQPQRGPVALLATLLLGPIAPPPPDVAPEIWFEAAAAAAAGGADLGPAPEPAGANPAAMAGAAAAAAPAADGGGGGGGAFNAGGADGEAIHGPLALGALQQAQNVPGGGHLQQQGQPQQAPTDVATAAERADQVAAVLRYTEAVAVANTALLHVEAMQQHQEAQASVLLARILAAQAAEENGQQQQQQQGPQQQQAQGAVWVEQGQQPAAGDGIQEDVAAAAAADE